MTELDHTTKPISPTFWVLLVIAVLLAVVAWYMIWGEDWLDHRAYCLSGGRSGVDDLLYDLCMERVSNL